MEYMENSQGVSVAGAEWPEKMDSGVFCGKVHRTSDGLNVTRERKNPEQRLGFLPLRRRTYAADA